MIRTIPRKLTELGRIRIGWQAPNKSGKGKHPEKLGEFRLTSSNKPLLHQAAALYGGEVRPWTDAPSAGQFELFTTTNAIDVLIPTESAVRVSYEVWSGGGCQKRCDGCFITHSAKPEQVTTECDCPADDHERAELAKDGRACARILRLNVLLPDLPGMGVWRLETKGFFATAELLGTLEMLSGVGMAHTIIEAVLRLEQRTVKSEGKTRNFAVPVLWPKWTPRQLLAGSSLAMIEAPAPTQKALPVAQQLATLTEELYGAPTPLAQAQCSPVGEAITALLVAAGLDATAQEAAWQKWQAKYPDLTPAVLAMIRDGLAEKLARPVAHDEPPAPEEDAPSLWAQEEAASVTVEVVDGDIPF